MEINSKDIRFGNIISHTFPGIILMMEVIIGFDLLTDKRICYTLFNEMKNVPNLIALLIVYTVIATMFGLIIDATQHFFTDIIQSIIHKGKNYKFFIAHKKIKNIEQLNIYDYFCIDNLWYYYECYANTALALIPGIFVAPKVISIMGINKPWNWLASVSILIFIIILTVEACITYLQSAQVEKEISRNM